MTLKKCWGDIFYNTKRGMYAIIMILIISIVIISLERLHFLIFNAFQVKFKAFQWLKKKRSNLIMTLAIIVKNTQKKKTKTKRQQTIPCAPYQGEQLTGVLILTSWCILCWISSFRVLYTYMLCNKNHNSLPPSFS